ncbi:glycosyltransferase domain protein [Ochrobactrum sp. CDB2]|nr:glycosyltransferase domain protein [Ochrobactrum sp. CDB2]
MAGRSDQKSKKVLVPFSENTQEDVADLIRKNNGLHAALDVLTGKLVKQETRTRDTIAQSMATVAELEQRALRAERSLMIIKDSVLWKTVHAISRSLDKYPRLKLFFRRSVKAMRWIATGQILSKVRQFYAVRNDAAGPGPAPVYEADPFGTFEVCPTALPPNLLSDIVSFMKAKGPVRLIVAVNFYAGGGAESAALGYAVSFAKSEPLSSVLFVMTDIGPRKSLPELPANVLVVDLVMTDGSHDNLVRQSYLFLLIQSTPVETFHLVNSIAAYNLLSRIPQAFLENLNVVASVYALQFDPLNRTRIVGYGKDFLPATIGRIDCVVTDNRQFAIEGPLKLGLSDSARKFKIVYNKSKLAETISVADSFRLMNQRLSYKPSRGRLKVVWAGRLDREKRTDLLMEVAGLTQHFCDFLVYGGSVVDNDYEHHIENLPNLSVMGPFRLPTEWDSPHQANVFLFTSTWEGMPNTLIEAAYMGYPVIASNVGGVGELITAQTGWALDRYADASAYAEALAEIFENLTEARQRTQKLIELVHARHNERAYLSSLSTVPGYSKVK